MYRFADPIHGDTARANVSNSAEFKSDTAHHSIPDFVQEIKWKPCRVSVLIPAVAAPADGHTNKLIVVLPALVDQRGHRPVIQKIETAPQQRISLASQVGHGRRKIEPPAERMASRCADPSIRRR